MARLVWAIHVFTIAPAKKTRIADLSPLGSATLPPYLPSISRIASRRRAERAARHLPRRKPREPDWTAIRAVWVAGAMPLAEMARAHDVPWQTIKARARREAWPAPGSAPVSPVEAEPTAQGKRASARQLASRLRDLIEREIADIEIEKSGKRAAADQERAARRLASLVRSLDKLNEIDHADKARRDARAAARATQEEDHRAELESRLARLADVMAAEAGAAGEPEPA